MLFRLTAVLPLILASLVLAQDSTEGYNDEGYFEDFPLECKDTCNEMNGIMSNCAALGDSVAEAEAFACVCTETFSIALQNCGSCIVPKASESSESAGTVLQLAISFNRGCGLPLKIDGVSNEISSVLANPSSAAYGAATSLPVQEATTMDTGSMTTTESSTTASSSSSTASSTSSNPTATPTGANDTSAASSLRPLAASIVVGLVGLAMAA